MQLAKPSVWPLGSHGLLVFTINYSADKHRNQRRKDKDATPYINHPLAVLNILMNEAGIGDITTLQAAVLHDTIEDTGTTEKELSFEFGPKVADVVVEVSDDKSLPKAERKRLQVVNAPHKSLRAKLVKLADFISNLRDLAVNPPEDWSVARVQEYFDWALAVVQGLRDADPVLARLFDQAYQLKPLSDPALVAVKSFKQWLADADIFAAVCHANGELVVSLDAPTADVLSRLPTVYQGFVVRPKTSSGSLDATRPYE